MAAEAYADPKSPSSLSPSAQSVRGNFINVRLSKSGYTVFNKIIFSILVKSYSAQSTDNYTYTAILNYPIVIINDP